MAKTRINISIDQDLAEFAREYAKENRATVAAIVTQYFLKLKKRKRSHRCPECHSLMWSVLDNGNRSCFKCGKEF